MRRVLTKEHKQKISIAMRGENNPNHGKQLSKDHRENIRISMLLFWSKLRENIQKTQ